MKYLIVYPILLFFGVLPWFLLVFFQTKHPDMMPYFWGVLGTIIVFNAGFQTHKVIQDVEKKHAGN